MDKKDSFDLNDIFKAHYQYCIERLMMNLKCQKHDAEDCFMDALIKLQEQIKKDTFKEINTRGWLITVAKNTFLSQKTGKFKVVPINVEKVEAYLGRQKGVYDDSFNPLLKKEMLTQLKTEEKNQIDAYKQAFDQLSTACKKILNRLKQGSRLKDLTEELGYSSYNSLKTSKARCIKNLKANSQNILNN